MKIKKITLCTLAVVAAASAAFLCLLPARALDELFVSQNDETFYFCMTEEVTGGALLITNSFMSPWQMTAVRFEMPSTGFTNTFTMDYIRRMATNQYGGLVVVTNPFGQIETNWYPQVTNTIVQNITNRIFTAVTTNDGSVCYSAELPNVYVIEDDEVLLSWTYTNAFHVMIDGGR